MRQLAILLLGAAWLTTSPAYAGPGVKVGDKAPEIAADWMNLPKGLKLISSRDLQGKVLFVEFWATW